MRYAVTIATLIASIFGVTGTVQACGVERWSAKVLADGSSLVGPYSSTVVALRNIARPADDPFGARIPAERYVYRVQAELLGFKLESDGDIHLVIAQPGERSKTMIAEIPDPKCMDGAPVPYFRQVQYARLEFVRSFGVPPVREFRIAYAPIIVTGPLFFDFRHGQSGSAPNNAEIHPVLEVAATTAVPYGTRAAPRPVEHRAATYPAGQCPGDVLVWVNTRTGIYHLPGSRWYGTTRRGEYMCRKAADADGYRAAENE